MGYVGAMETQASHLDEAAKRKLLNRLSRVEGKVRALKKMVEETQCADEIIVQAAAARKPCYMPDGQLRNCRKARRAGFARRTY